jgi:hypothetical protein
MNLPRKCFISHSYKDAEARQALLMQLPRAVEPFVFPPITVSPEQVVSNKLLDAIRACDGLIYLQGGASVESFWVALERDYALRLGKPAFRYDPATGALSRDLDPAMTLSAHFAYARADTDVAEKLEAELRRLYFNVWIDMPLAPDRSHDEKVVESAIDSVIQDGGYVLVLVTRRTTKSDWVRTQIDISVRNIYGRVLYVLVEDCDAASEARTTKQWVQIYGDNVRSWVHRIDDLIVRLYWLIYRNTRQNQLS